MKTSGFVRRGGNEGVTLPTLLLPSTSLPRCQLPEQLLGGVLGANGEEERREPAGSCWQRGSLAEASPGGLGCGWAETKPAPAWLSDAAALRGREGGRTGRPARWRAAGILRVCSRIARIFLPTPCLVTSPRAQWQMGSNAVLLVPFVVSRAKLLTKLDFLWG